MNRCYALIVAIAGFMTTACGAPEGSVQLRFVVQENVRKSAIDPLKGPVYGEILPAEEVDFQGKIPGAAPTTRIHAVQVDLTASDVSPQAWTGSLGSGTYVFLGFLDVDNNATPPPYADRGDPVTLPSGALSRQFEIREDKPITQLVVFDFIMF